MYQKLAQLLAVNFFHLGQDGEKENSNIDNRILVLLVVHKTIMNNGNQQLNRFVTFKAARKCIVMVMEFFYIKLPAKYRNLASWHVEFSFPKMEKIHNISSILR